MNKRFEDYVDWEWAAFRDRINDAPLSVARDEAFLLTVWERAVQRGYRGNISRLGVAKVVRRVMAKLH